MEGLMPTFDVNGNGNCNNGWGGAGGAFAGALVGSALFNGGWGGFGGGWGNRGGNCGGGNCGDQFIMDTLTTMRSDVNSIGREQLVQAASNNANMCTGFGTVNASIERVGAAQALAQCRTEAAVLEMGNQTQLQAKDNTFAIVTSQKDCCCETQRLIEREFCSLREATHAEGEATRAMITNNEMQALRDRNCDLKAELSACQQRQFAEQLSLQAQNNIITHVRSFIPTTTTTTPA